MGRNGKNGSTLKFSDVIDLVSALRKFTSKIKDFKFPKHISSGLHEAADLYTTGNEKQAIEKALYGIRGTYRIVAAYFRNAIPKHFEPRFKVLETEGYPKDILEGLRSKMNSLDYAVRTETGNDRPEDFSSRLACYDTVYDGFQSAPGKFMERKSNQAKKRAEEEAKKAAEQIERQREIAQQQREAALAKRQAEAETLKSLLSQHPKADQV